MAFIGLLRWQTCNYNCCNYKALSIDQFLTFTIKIFNEVNLYPTCGQSAQDKYACFLFGSFKFKTKRSIVRASTNLSTASLAGRPERILTLSPAAVWTHSNCAFTPQAARASKWPEVIHFQCEPATSSGESGAASFGRWERRGELKSSQLHGNELWRGSAATNRNVEVLRLRGFQRTQSCKLWFRPH